MRILHELVYVGSVRIPFLYDGVLLYYLSPKVNSRFIYILCIQLHFKCRKYLQQTKFWKKSFVTALRNRLMLDISHESSPHQVLNYIFHKIRKYFTKKCRLLTSWKALFGSNAGDTQNGEVLHTLYFICQPDTHLSNISNIVCLLCRVNIPRAKNRKPAD